MCECNRSCEAEVQRKRADFFRDALAEQGCPPRSRGIPCAGQPCPYDCDGDPDYAACWDEVERRQR